MNRIILAEEFMDKEYLESLVERLEKMPAEVLRYISGAVDMAEMLDVSVKSEKQRE